MADQQLEETPKVTIIFDTSILHKLRLANLSPEFRLIQRLAESKKLVAMVPEMAAREWLSQLTQDASDAIEGLSSSLHHFHRHLRRLEDPDVKRLAESSLHTEETLSAIKSRTEQWYKRRLSSLGLRSIAMDPADLPSIVDDYFSGAPPFANKKKREDIPDALILAGVRRMCGPSNSVVFVCHDNNLAKAGEKVGAHVVRSLPDLLKLQIVASLHSNAAFAIWWERNLKDVVAKIQGTQPQLEELLERDLESSVTDMMIHHYALPEDNSEARVACASDIGDVQFNWSMSESLGEGLLSVPIHFQADTELDFYVYRGDIMDVPDWVAVSYGDFENDHYFEAHGYIRSIFEGRLVIGLDASVMDGDLEILDADTSVEDVQFRDFADKGTL